MRDPVYGSPARMRVEQQSARRGNAPVVITTVLSLLVVAVAVAAVAWLVLRAPSEAVDSAERLEPVGTALPAPSEQPTLPTPIPTTESEPVAPGFSGDAPDVSGLPTVAAPQVAAPQAEAAGPTPTPRVLALPTAPPPTPPPTQPTPLPAPTLPPSVPVDAAPVVALAPVEFDPPAAPTAAANVAQVENDLQPERDTPEFDDDPFNIFGDENGSRINPAQDDALARVRDIQEAAAGDDDEAERGDDGFDPVVVPVIVPAGGEAAITERSDGTVEIVMPDVDAMIDEITANVTDPNRNPNVSDAGRQENERNRDEDEDDDDRARDGDDDRDDGPAENRRKSALDRINERRNRPAAAPGQSTRDAVPAIVPSAGGNDNRGNQNNQNQNQNQNQDCNSAFENLPEDRRPQGFPFDDC